MLYYFLYPLRDYLFFFNIFKYITFRAVGASVTAFLIAIFLGPFVIRWLARFRVMNETKREHADKIHLFYEAKDKIPTMGGVLIVGSLLVSNLLWGDLSNRYLWILLLVVLWFGAIGFVDDFLKLKNGNTRGLSSLVKLIGQFILGISLGTFLYLDGTFPKLLYIPFLKEVTIYLGIWFVPFIVLVLVGTSNALNLTDGLDGLAVGCLAFAAGAFAILTYLAGRADFSPSSSLLRFTE